MSKKILILTTKEDMQDTLYWDILERLSAKGCKVTINVSSKKLEIITNDVEVTIMRNRSFGLDYTGISRYVMFDQIYHDDSIEEEFPTKLEEYAKCLTYRSNVQKVKYWNANGITIQISEMANGNKLRALKYKLGKFVGRYA